MTVRVADAEVTPENAAVMAEDPTPTAVASPFEPDALLMDAVAVFDEFQVAQAVRFCTVPSARVPEAENCAAVPLAMLLLAGVTVIDATADEVSVAEPTTPP